MAKPELKAELKLEMHINLRLSICEAEALKEIVEYDPAEVIELIEQKYGKHYIADHRPFVKSLFETVKKELPAKLYNAEQIKEAIKNIKGLNQ